MSMAKSIMPASTGTSTCSSATTSTTFCFGPFFFDLTSDYGSECSEITEAFLPPLERIFYSTFEIARLLPIYSLNKKFVFGASTSSNFVAPYFFAICDGAGLYST
jgi:hypothetical protein